MVFLKWYNVFYGQTDLPFWLLVTEKIIMNIAKYGGLCTRCLLKPWHLSLANAIRRIIWRRASSDRHIVAFSNSMLHLWARKFGNGAEGALPYTVQYRYNAVKYSTIFHAAYHWPMQNVNQSLGSQNTLTGELWSVYGMNLEKDGCF